jgi:hypothetical protein
MRGPVRGKHSKIKRFSCGNGVFIGDWSGILVSWLMGFK